MMLRIFSLYDSATAQYGNPMFLISRNQAIRSLSDEVNRKDQQNPLFMHPKDYLLFELGQFDTDSGKFYLGDVPEQVARLEDLAHE